MKKMKDYTYHAGIEMRAYGSRKQKNTVRMQGGSSRFVYNRLISIDRRLYELRKVKTYLQPVQEEIDRLMQQRDMKNLMNAAPFLYDVDSNLIYNAKKNHSDAWDRCKKGLAGRPVYHKKTNKYTYQTNPHYNKDSVSMNDCKGFYFVDKKHVVLPKLGKVRVKASKKLIDALFSRTAETRLGTVTVTLDETDRLYISVQLGSDEPFVEEYKKTGSETAFDLNLSNFLTDAEGNVIDTPHFLKKSEEKIMRLQKKLSRKAERAKQEGRDLSECVEYQKLRIRLTEEHKHVANQRSNFHHNVASMMLKNHDIVYAEDLKVKNLVKNHKLAKAISDAGWSQFLGIMEQKAAMRGKTFINVPPQNTTQTCCACGHVMKGDEHIGLGVEEWTCPKCGVHHIRDHNAAINIIHKGIAMTA